LSAENLGCGGRLDDRRVPAILNIQSSAHRWPIFKADRPRNRRWRLDHDPYLIAEIIVIP